MKILVVDDDPVARKVLGSFLQQSKYEMQILEDGLSAFRAMTTPDAPLIAIIDWVMPDLTGPELCIKLRAFNFAVQPYLIILSGRKEKTDIVQALDSGADDFIAKPFNIQETQARLRVAVRSVDRQQALRQKLGELEAALATKNQAEDAAPDANQPSVEETQFDHPKKKVVHLDALDCDQIDAVVGEALRSSGISTSSRRAPAGFYSDAHPVVWTSLLVASDEVWLDLMLETDHANLAMLFEQTRGRQAADGYELASLCTTLQTAIRDALESAFRAAEKQVVVPGPSHAISGSDLYCPLLPEQHVQRHHYQIGVASLTVVVVRQASPVVSKNTDQLQLFDILAGAYPPVNTHHVPLLRAGVVLNDHYIEKLRSFTQASAREVPPILVHTPTTLSLQHLWEASVPKATQA